MVGSVQLTFFMRFFTTFLSSLTSLLIGFGINAQVVADFENIPLAAASFLNGSDGRSSFSSGEIELPVNYTAAFDSWSGWAISSVQDNSTSGFGNQYASIAGSGREGSQNYAVSYAPFSSVLRLPAPRVVSELWVTNSTYAYYSMLEGDAFAKRFGGETGNDPDFLLLTIRGYSNGMELPNPIELYLADYRFTNNSEDYILSDWTQLNPAAFGVVDSLIFSLTSSDVGDFGINTPTYFCLDDVQTSLPTNTTGLASTSESIRVYPNPIQGNWLYISGVEPLSEMAYQLYDQLGRLQAQGLTNGRISLGAWPSGSYVLRLETAQGRVQRRVQLVR